MSGYSKKLTSLERDQCEAMFESALRSHLGGEIKTNNFWYAKRTLLQYKKDSQREDLKCFQLRPGVDDPDHTIWILKMDAEIETERSVPQLPLSGVMY